MFGLDDDSISNEEINKIMRLRKPHLNNQLDACNVRAKLCDSIQKIKLQDPEIVSKLESLKATDYKLYNYVYNLETINNGVWCDKCGSVKNTKAAEAIIDRGLTDQISDSHNQIKQFSAEVNSILADFISKVDTVCLNAANLEESLKNQYMTFALKK